MQKKARLRLKLKKGETPKVKKGDTVTHGQVLIIGPTLTLNEFSLAEALGVVAADVEKHLVVKVDTHIKKGDVLAKKGGLLSKKVIKSPISGVFVWVSQDQGIVGVKDEATKPDEVTAWFDGTVEDVSDEAVVVAVSGTPIAGKAGRGGPASGKLLIVSEGITVFSMPTDIESRVLAIKTVAPDMVAKADALGATAIITEDIEEPPFTLPYLLVENIESLSKFHEKTVIVHGEAKELLVIDESTRKPSKT